MTKSTLYCQLKKKQLVKKSGKKGQLRLELTSLTDDDRPVYVAGTFNDWKAADPDYLMTKVSPGKFVYVFEDSSHISFPAEYKYLRGGWKEEELDKHGNKPTNRLLLKPSGTIRDKVIRWRWDGLDYNKELLPVIEVLSDEFEVPHPIKTRRIAALLPHDYYETDRHYPVLYLQDGQNLFDDYAPFGNWGVDKKLSILTERGMGDVIIISIDHAAEERIAEFTPSIQTKLGLGKGRKYVRFLTDTLKPYVDGHYRTLTDRDHTGIGGSSMGGLISIYAGLLHPEVFGRLLVFSPSLWVAPNIHFNAIRFNQSLETFIYLYAGGKEGANMIPNVKRFKEALEHQGIDRSRIRFKLSIDPLGQHNEARWGAEFPKALEWLFYNPTIEEDENPNTKSLRESGQ